MSSRNWADETVLLLGAHGMLGRDLAPRLEERLQAIGARLLAWDKDKLDITDRAAVLEMVDRAAPATVINCAAYTDVDGCETQPAEAMAVNADGPAYLAEISRAIGAQLVHFGTDFVFDGLANRPYRPEDPSHPLSVYGHSKFLGTRAVCMSGCRHLLIRTSWLYGLHGRNFVETILEKARRGVVLKVVDDQVGRPCFTVDLCEALIRLLNAGAEGVVHFANEGECSWHEFAKEIVERCGLNVPVEAISSRELGRPARRPAYSVLDLSSYQSLTQHTPRPWQEALKDYLHQRTGRNRGQDSDQTKVAMA